MWLVGLGVGDRQCERDVLLSQNPSNGKGQGGSFRRKGTEEL